MEVGADVVLGAAGRASGQSGKTGIVEVRDDARQLVGEWIEDTGERSVHRGSVRLVLQRVYLDALPKERSAATTAPC